MTAADGSRLSTDTAWLSLFANVLVLPGLGTLLLGRRLLGGAQLLFTLLGLWLVLSDGAFTEAFALGLLVGALVWATATAVSALSSARSEM